MAKLAVYFPGIGYHCDKPLLYYSKKIACGLGYYDYIDIVYSSKPGNIRGNLEKMTEAYELLFSQAESQLAHVTWADYDNILFVSKSIGTIIAASYVKKYNMQNVRHILYTPLVQTFRFAPEQAIAFIGTSDPWSDVGEIIQTAEASHIPLYVYEGCNHSLECDDVLKNLDNLKNVMEKTLDFLL